MGSIGGIGSGLGGHDSEGWNGVDEGSRDV